MAAVDTLRDHMVLVNHKKKRPGLDVIELITGDPDLVLTMDGASTIKLVCSDATRNLVTSGLLDTRSWINVDGNQFEFVGLNKSGTQVTLTYEDAIVAALRRRTKHLVAPAGSTTRPAFAKRLAHEAHVKIDCDPGHRQKVRDVLERSAKANSWDLLASVLTPINWRRFSDMTQLVVGSDDWLHSRYKPLEIRENSGPVNNIDFDLDVGKRASTARVTVNAEQWAGMPGVPVQILDLGPASGRWLVNEFRRPLTSSQATVTLTRPKHELKEPRKKNKSGQQGKGKGHGKGDDKGDPAGGGHRSAETGLDDYLPGLEGTLAGSQPTTGPREAAVAFALAQVGRPYEDGSSGPDGYDSSGLVEAATRAAGRPLRAPARLQWDRLVETSSTITIAEALRIRGALLFRIGEEPAVAISLGNGSTVEALGPAYGVAIATAADRDWTGAGLWV